AEDGIRDLTVTGVQTCALPISFISIAIAVFRRRRHHAADVRRRERAAIEMKVEVAGAFDAHARDVLRQMQSVRDRLGDFARLARSEERRVGKECGCGWWSDVYE